MVTETCKLCGVRKGVSAHHLIPQEFMRNYLSRESYLNPDAIVMLCVPCHGYIHQVFSNHELRDQYNMVEKILEALEQRHIIDALQNLRMQRKLKSLVEQERERQRKRERIKRKYREYMRIHYEIKSVMSGK